jgi:formate-dependent nitrite reductase cytochrome c552 subunit
MLRTLAEARAAGETWYFTGKPCVRGHVCKRWVGDRSCAECSNAKAKRWHATNPERSKELFQQWRAKNAEHDKAKSREWQLANREKTIAGIARYEAGKDKRTPPWADHAAIDAIYSRCREVSAETGVEHHVDHEIPLHGRRVSGLHVPANLRVIPAVDNKKKSNSFSIDG